MWCDVMCFSMRKDIMESGWIEKNWKNEKKNFLNFDPRGLPQQGDFHPGQLKKRGNL